MCLKCSHDNFRTLNLVYKTVYFVVISLCLVFYIINCHKGKCCLFQKSETFSKLDWIFISKMFLNDLSGGESGFISSSHHILHYVLIQYLPKWCHIINSDHVFRNSSHIDRNHDRQHVITNTGHDNNNIRQVISWIYVF